MAEKEWISGRKVTNVWFWISSPRCLCWWRLQRLGIQGYESRLDTAYSGWVSSPRGSMGSGGSWGWNPGDHWHQRRARCLCKRQERQKRERAKELGFKQKTNGQFVKYCRMKMWLRLEVCLKRPSRSDCFLRRETWTHPRSPWEHQMMITMLPDGQSCA